MSYNVVWRYIIYLYQRISEWIIGLDQKILEMCFRYVKRIKFKIQNILLKIFQAEDIQDII